MIHRGPNAERYEVLQFTCSHGGKHASGGQEFARALWTLVENERDPYMWYIWKKMTWNTVWGSGSETIWQKRIGVKWQDHVVTKGVQAVNPKFWSLSKTGEINITEFKHRFKEAVARFLAGAVEG